MKLKRFFSVFSFSLLSILKTEYAQCELNLSNLLKGFDQGGVVVAVEGDDFLNQITVQEQFKDWLEHDWTHSCPMNCKPESFSPENPFCVLSYETFKKSRMKDKKIHTRLQKRLMVRSLVRLLKKAPRLNSEHFQAIEGAAESDWILALKSVKRPRELENVINAVASLPGCLSPQVYMALGLRLEAEFPKNEFRALTSSLYDRAFRCSQIQGNLAKASLVDVSLPFVPSMSDIAGVHAGYRLGLMKIWEGKCDSAEEVLSKIPDEPATADYRLRIGYWRYFCANQMKNDVLKTQMANWVLREYPLSLHALLIQTDIFKNKLEPRLFDPEVASRSQLDEELNYAARAIEHLISEGERVVAHRLLEFYTPRVLNAELSFQLYWAYLFKKSGSGPSTFQMMASIFRANPHLISKETLEMMYPLEKWETVQDSKSIHSNLDPYLVLSIIRQESAFNEKARSPAGAFGLMQLLPATARRYKRVSRAQLYDGKLNVQIGMKYFDHLLTFYEGRTELALAAYNAGPERVRQWRQRYPIDNRLLFIDFLPVRETRDYVSSIARNYYWYLKLYYPQWMDQDETHPTRLRIEQFLALSKSP